MIIESEHSKVLKKTPKLFLYDYSAYFDRRDKLFNPVIERQRGLEDRFYHFCLSEKLFCYLKDGLNNGKTVYETRLDEIRKKSPKILGTPLLLIFKHSRFVTAPIKTPELYFEVYKEIIHGIAHKKLSKYISLLKKGQADTQFYEAIETMMSSENLGVHDLAYINLNLDEVDLYRILYNMTTRVHPLFNGLFQSDLNSHIVEYFFELANELSYDFIDRIIKNGGASGLHYIANWKFENGVDLLAWFKAYMSFIKKKPPMEYITGTLNRYGYLRTLFLQHDILQSKVQDMLPDFQDNVTSLNLPANNEAIFLGNQNEVIPNVLDWISGEFADQSESFYPEHRLDPNQLISAQNPNFEEYISSFDSTQYETMPGSHSDSIESKKSKVEDYTASSFDLLTDPQRDSHILINENDSYSEQYIRFLLKKNEKRDLAFQAIPKLFLKNYATYVREKNELPRSKVAEQQKDSNCEFNYFSPSEKVFCYLKEGLEQSEKIFKSRYDEIKNYHKTILQKALILIFTHTSFTDSKIKTPDLYFKIYKLIIFNKRFKLNALDQFFSSKSLPKFNIETINNILVSENLETKDFIYLYLNFATSNFFKLMHDISSQQSTLLKCLFESGIASHFVDYMFELKNKFTFIFIDRLIRSQKKAAIEYLISWKFKNGVNILAWFKGYMYYVENESPEKYTTGAFKKYHELKKQFDYHDIFQDNISIMFNVGNESQASASLSENAHDVVYAKKLKTQRNEALSDPFFVKSKTGFDRNGIPLESEFKPIVGECFDLINDENMFAEPLSIDTNLSIPVDPFTKRKFELRFFSSESFGRDNPPRNLSGFSKKEYTFK